MKLDKINTKINTRTAVLFIAVGLLLFGLYTWMYIANELTLRIGLELSTYSFASLPVLLFSLLISFGIVSITAKRKPSLRKLLGLTLLVSLLIFTILFAIFLWLDSTFYFADWGNDGFYGWSSKV
ncbi:MAG: hypothetical protein V4611_03955 [Patescibacteria group bacterium]